MICVEWYWLVVIVVLSVAIGLVFGFVSGVVMEDGVFCGEEDELS